MMAGAWTPSNWIALAAIVVAPFVTWTAIVVEARMRRAEREREERRTARARLASVAQVLAEFSEWFALRSLRTEEGLEPVEGRWLAVKPDVLMLNTVWKIDEAQALFVAMSGAFPRAHALFTTSGEVAEEFEADIDVRIATAIVAIDEVVRQLQDPPRARWWRRRESA